MSNRNYTPYSKMSGEEPMLVNDACGLDGCCNSFNQTENESAVIEQPIEGQTSIPEIVVEPAVMITPVEPEPTIEPEIRKIGKIVGCKKLNVRELPNKGSKVLTEILAGVEVMIDDKASTATFYKVCTEHGIEGYCVKEFVKILP